MKNLKSLLDNSSLKTTPQRLAILKEIDKKGHANIDEIYEEIKELFPTISLATIYKNINALKEEGIITEICIHDKSKYELKKEMHAHFICKECLKIKDIPFPTIEGFYPELEKELYVYGVCVDCKDAN